MENIFRFRRNHLVRAMVPKRGKIYFVTQNTMTVIIKSSLQYQINGYLHINSCFIHAFHNYQGINFFFFFGGNTFCNA